MAKKNNRFEVVFMDGNSIKDGGQREILVDTETGVNYLWHSEGGNAGGLTVLLNADGTPVITPRSRLMEE